MKRYIILFLLMVVGFGSCKDFLDVQAPSKIEEPYIFASTDEMNKALTAVYASLLTNDSYGSSLMTNFALNSDVEFKTFTSVVPSGGGNDIQRFDAARNGSNINSLWKAMYLTIERANIVVDGITNSPLYNNSDATTQKKMDQMLGEAKTLRAMVYHDLVVIFGDVPFSFTKAYDKADDMVMPMEDRNKILQTCIDDVKMAQQKMQYASEIQDGVKRASKEFAQGLIARMAMTRGGYALYPDKNNTSSTGTMQRQGDYLDYYEIAKNYADSVIVSQSHKLTKGFRNVFINECNFIASDNHDDPIFEIPFLRSFSGSVGYVHGPTGEVINSASSGANVWGKASPGSTLNALYPYTFDTEDLRVGYTVGMWYYSAVGTPTLRNDFYVYNNKWSKFWTDKSSLNTAISVSSEGGTGIAYPYMRYAEILLIYAEAVNELENGVSGENGLKARTALREVRERAFRGSANSGAKVDGYISTVSASKESFFDAIFNERKWELGGENMRWKDLVRWNLYSKVVVETFMDYYMISLFRGGDEYDDPNFDVYKWMNLPFDLYWKTAPNPVDINVYPNTSLQILTLYNQFNSAFSPGTGWTSAKMFNWWDDMGYPKTAVYYSWRGYIRDGEGSNFRTLLSKYPNNLPPVRYILPIPQDAISRSKGKYKNYYGY